MNQAERNQIYEAENNGWNFRHLMGSKMMASNGIVGHIVETTNSVDGYRALLKLINQN